MRAPSVASVRGVKENPKEVVAPEKTTFEKYGPFIVPVIGTIAFSIVIPLTDNWDRTWSHWPMGLVSAFGSFISGTAPEGASIISFPIFTKGFHMKTKVTRSFNIAQSTIGMSMAFMTILILKRPFDKRAAMFAVPAGAAGLLVALYGMSDRDDAYWNAIDLTGSFIKVTFDLYMFSLGLTFLMLYQEHEHRIASARSPASVGSFSKYGHDQIPHWNWRVASGIMICCFMGGWVYGFSGSGFKLMLFLFCAGICDMKPKTTIFTCIVAFFFLNWFAFILIGIEPGHDEYDITLDSNDDVVNVGGHQVEPGTELDGFKYDILGMLLASVVPTLWGPVFGTIFLTYLREEYVVYLILILVCIELFVTFTCLDEIYSQLGLFMYAYGGIMTLIPIMVLTRRYRYQLLDFPQHLQMSHNMNLDDVHDDAASEMSHTIREGKGLLEGYDHGNGDVEDRRSEHSFHQE